MINPPPLEGDSLMLPFQYKIRNTLNKNLTDLGNSIFTSLMSTEQFGESILKRAINNVVNEYTNINSDGETITTKYSYEN